MQSKFEWFVYVVCCLIWGSTWVGIKTGLQFLPPFTFASLRLFVASATLAVFLKLMHVRIPTDRSSLKVMTFLGASQSAQFALVFWAQQYLPSGLGSVLFATNSFFVLIFAHTITQSERITRVKLLGVGAAFVGVVAIFWPDIFLSQNAATQLYLMAGLALITSAMLSALTSVIVKRYAGGIHPAASVFSQALIGAVVLFSAGWLAEAGLPKAAPASAIAAILYLGIFGSAVAFVGMYWLLTKTTATNVSLMVFFTPIIALILGWAVFNEVPEVNVAIGATLILAGVYVTAKTSSTPH